MNVPFQVYHMKNPETCIYTHESPVKQLYLVYCDAPLNIEKTALLLETIPDYDILLDWLIYVERTFEAYTGENIVIANVNDQDVEFFNDQDIIHIAYSDIVKAVQQLGQRG